MMTRIYFIVGFWITFSNPLFAQWTTSGNSIYNSNSGYVGIGTSTPNSKLDLGTGYGANGVKLLIYNDNSTNELAGTKCGFYMDNFRPNNLNLVFPEHTSYPGLFTVSAKNTSGATLNPYFSIVGLTGNVGIGTINPQAKLDVNGGGIILRNSLGNQVSIQTNTSRWDLDVDEGVNNSFRLRNITTATIPLLVTTTGNVGIGTSSPNQKLTVNGTIYGKEVKVDLSVPGPDYVFDNDYQLTSLDSIQSYIHQNKHLPEVPSAKEMETNGINLSEMNMLLLKKVEELTLYLLHQQQEIDYLKKRVNESNK